MADLLSRTINASLPARRAIALLLLFFAAALLGGLIWAAATSMAQIQAEIEEKRETVGRLQGIAALKPGLMQHNGSDLLKASSEDFLEGESEAVVRANLQAQLSTIVAGHNATLQSASNLPDLDIDGARYIGMRADLSGTVEAVHNAIFTIERFRPLVIRDASIWLSGPDQGIDATRAPEISTQIRIFGALRPDVQATGEKAAP